MKTNDNFLRQKYDEIFKKELIQQSDQDFYLLYQLFRLFTFYQEHQYDRLGMKDYVSKQSQNDDLETICLAWCN